MDAKISHKALIISNKPPYPILDGGCFAMSKFEQLTKQSFDELFYFALSTPKHPFDENALPRDWKLNDNFYTDFVNTTIQNKHVIKYFAGSSIRATRFYSSSIEKKILALVETKKIDVVIFESIYSAVYLKAIKKIPGIKIFIRAHNIEHRIWEKYFETMPRGLKRLAFRSETNRLKEFEEYCFEQSDGNIFISQKDYDYANEHSKTRQKKDLYLPVQLSIHPYQKRVTQKSLKLFHLGAMDWLPNREGIENFILNIFPAILKSFPDVELHLAGKSMPDSFKQHGSNRIFIHGQVKDALAFIQPYDVLVVPIESGSGLRIKILESMASGKPVISTSVGIQGIHAEPQREYLLANTVDGWVKAIQFLNEPNNYNQTAQNAVHYIEQHYSENALLSQLSIFFQNQLKF